jgi:hypothetical protein
VVAAVSSGGAGKVAEGVVLVATRARAAVVGGAKVLRTRIARVPVPLVAAVACAIRSISGSRVCMPVAVRIRGAELLADWVVHERRCARPAPCSSVEIRGAVVALSHVPVRGGVGYCNPLIATGAVAASHNRPAHRVGVAVTRGWDGAHGVARGVGA